MEAKPRKLYHCLRCGWEWFAREDKRPIRCGNRKCQSPYYDKPRKDPKPPKVPA